MCSAHDGSDSDYNFDFVKDANAGTRTVANGANFTAISIAYTPVNSPPVAEPQTVTVRDGAPVSFTLIATDADDDPITYNFLSLPARGHLIGTPPELTYVPPKGLNGATLKFLFSVSDASNMGNSEYVSLDLVFEDTSGNGIPDSWEAAYGVTNATADSDHDGASNYQEYMAGTNPTNGTSVLAMNPPQLSGGSDVVLQWNSAEYKFYNIQSSTNLLNGWDTIGSTHMATPPVNSYTGIVNSAGSTYYRISLEP
jgi:hypothetical protein